MIRPFQASDQESLIQILRLNTPEFFDISEEKDFLYYLANHADHYRVIEWEGAVAGGGGYNYLPEREARISWDLIDPRCQGNGLGSALTNFRIEEIKKHNQSDRIVVRTSQLAFEFYAKFGFELVRTEKDFWAKGYDLYQMEMMLL